MKKFLKLFLAIMLGLTIYHVTNEPYDVAGDEDYPPVTVNKKG